MSVQDAIEIEGDPAAVYRLFAADGILLYVGMTRDITGRFTAHETKPWWPDVARKTMRWYGSRESALAAEAAAIVAERPVHNIAGNPCDEIPKARTGRARSWAAAAAESAGLPAPARKILPGEPRQVRKYSHARLAAHLEARIKAGEFASARRLPTAGELQLEYKAGAITVRRALAALLERGLVTQQGTGGTAGLKVKRVRAPRKPRGKKPAAGPFRMKQPGTLEIRFPGWKPVTVECQEPLVNPLADAVWTGVSFRTAPRQLRQPSAPP